jgi:isopenicillin-N epimerase
VPRGDRPTRRAILGGALGAGGILGVLPALVRSSRWAAADDGDRRGDRWDAFRDLFELDPSKIHLAGMLLAPHARPVREAIERHRTAFEDDPASYVQRSHRREEARARQAAADYLGARPHEIALTFNTTTGLGLVYGGIAITRGQRFLTTEHDYRATHRAIRFRADRAGAEVDVIRLYDEPEAARADEIVERLVAGVRPRTRVVALTWVHSSSGVKLPLARIAGALAELNRKRDDADRLLLCVDGVHGLGVEREDVGALGCDVLVAGTHKWLFGPRGTGLVWARDDVHGALGPVIDSFTTDAGWGGELSPGGFHAFDHRWALPEAFALHAGLGKDAVADRIRALHTAFRQALVALDHVAVKTPAAAELSAGILCFEVRGRSPHEVVQALRARDIIASVTPYDPPYARLSPGLLNSLDEVDPVAAALATLA